MTLTLHYGSGSPYAWRVNLALEVQRRVILEATG